MFKVLLNFFWKNQNLAGRIQTLLIAVLLILFFYYKTAYSIYKRKEIEELKTKSIVLKNALLKLTKQQLTINKESEKLTKNLQVVSNKIEEKRKQDEIIIFNNTITDKQRKEFLSKYTKGQYLYIKRGL